MPFLDKSRGNTVTEYSLLAGLVALVALGALHLLGGSTSGLLGGIKQSEKPVLKLTSLDFGGAAAGLQKNVSGGAVTMTGPGYYTVAINPDTGVPSFQLTDSNTGAVKNATSIDGAQWNTLGQFHLADSLMKLADAQNDPVNAAYIRGLAEKSYYMAGAEGEIDGMPNLELDDVYGKLNGYYDIQRLQKDMQTMLASPPPGMDRQTLMQVMPLAADVNNISQAYLTALAPYTAKGEEFVMPSDLIGMRAGSPGQGLSVTPDQVTYCPTGCTVLPPNGPTIENVFPDLQALRTVSQKVLSNYQVSSEPVKATLTDATRLDNTATQNGEPVSTSQATANK